MVFYRKQNAWVLESDILITIFGFLMGGKYFALHAKGMACWPFVLVRNSECSTELIINHERIHLQQQKETLFIGLWLISLGEWMWARFYKGYTVEETYFYLACEQEAYRHQNDMNYLASRKMFALFKYLKDKKKSL